METLREARIRRFMSIRELARRAGVATRTIVDVEAGRITPRFVTTRKLADALMLEPADIAEFAAAMEAALTKGNDSG